MPFPLCKSHSRTYLCQEPFTPLLHPTINQSTKSLSLSRAKMTELLPPLARTMSMPKSCLLIQTALLLGLKTSQGRRSQCPGILLSTQTSRRNSRVSITTSIHCDEFLRKIGLSKIGKLPTDNETDEEHHCSAASSENVIKIFIHIHSFII